MANAPRPSRPGRLTWPGNLAPWGNLGERSFLPLPPSCLEVGTGGESLSFPVEGLVSWGPYFFRRLRPRIMEIGAPASGPGLDPFAIRWGISPGRIRLGRN